jgi:hypothetical protein
MPTAMRSQPPTFLIVLRPSLPLRTERSSGAWIVRCVRGHGTPGGASWCVSGQGLPHSTMHLPLERKYTCCDTPAAGHDMAGST